MKETLTRDEVFFTLNTDPIYYDQAEVICYKLFGAPNESKPPQFTTDSDTGAPTKPGPGSH